MNAFAVVLVLLIAVLGAFIATHLQPMTDVQVRDLALKRRQNQVHAYFAFIRGEVSVNPDVKSRLKPTGTYYEMSEPLTKWPGLAAGLLKYKKHEWIMIALERQEEVILLWVNKGANNTSVNLLVPITELISRARANGCTSILACHNHPNSNPRLFNCTNPGQTDVNTSVNWSSLAKAAGLNLVEFICERGNYYEYCRSITDVFHPVTQFIAEINATNGSSWSKNLGLHCERIFSRLFSVSPLAT